MAVYQHAVITCGTRYIYINQSLQSLISIILLFFNCSRKKVFEDIQRLVCPEDIINKVVFDMDDPR